MCESKNASFGIYIRYLIDPCFHTVSQKKERNKRFVIRPRKYSSRFSLVFFFLGPSVVQTHKTLCWLPSERALRAAAVSDTLSCDDQIYISHSENNFFSRFVGSIIAIRPTFCFGSFPKELVFRTKLCLSSA